MCSNGGGTPRPQPVAPARSGTRAAGLSSSRPSFSASSQWEVRVRILSRRFCVLPLNPPQKANAKGDLLSLLWIILIVILVLALLGFFTRGRW
jgi:hypothetical protein